MDQLTLKRVPLGCSRRWRRRRRIFLNAAAFEGRHWVWTLAYGHHEDRTPTHGFERTREDAMAAFAKSWRHE